MSGCGGGGGGDDDDEDEEEASLEGGGGGGGGVDSEPKYPPGDQATTVGATRERQ